MVESAYKRSCVPLVWEIYTRALYLKLMDFHLWISPRTVFKATKNFPSDSQTIVFLRYGQSSRIISANCFYINRSNAIKPLTVFHKLKKILQNS